MLSPNGEIHVNHRTASPYSEWKIEELGDEQLLEQIECAEFRKEHYPGYKNKRGDGDQCDESFPIGQCCTFKFSLPTQKKNKKKRDAIIKRDHQPDCLLKKEKEKERQKRKKEKKKHKKKKKNKKRDTINKQYQQHDCPLKKEKQKEKRRRKKKKNNKWGTINKKDQQQDCPLKKEKELEKRKRRKKKKNQKWDPVNERYQQHSNKGVAFVGYYLAAASLFCLLATIAALGKLYVLYFQS